MAVVQFERKWLETTSGAQTGKGQVLAQATRCLILVSALAAYIAAGHADAAGAPDARCDFYRRIDRRCACAGRDHYFLSYGQRYCERFVQSTGWSVAGARWRDRTLDCLKDELRRHLRAGSRGCDCATIKAFAFESHARCYTQRARSVCRLPLSDLGHIYRLVDTADLFDPGGSRQVLEITLACIWQNGNAGARPDDPTQ